MRVIFTVVINKPVQLVWDFFDNSDNMKLWLTGFVRFESISGTPGKIGATAKHVYEMNGKPFELIEEMTHRVENKLFRGDFSNAMLSSTITNNFTEHGSSITAIRCQSDVTFKGFMKFLSPLMKSGFQKRQDADLNKLKTTIESH